MRESGFDVRWMPMVRINFVKDVLSRDAASSIFMSYLELWLLALKFLKGEFRKLSIFIWYHRYSYSLIYYTARTAFLLRAYYVFSRIAFISHLSCFTELNTNILKFTLMQLISRNRMQTVFHLFLQAKRSTYE